jgi:hypothetical protein
MTHTGRCACGAVTLVITGQPVATRQCWCRQCQRTSGGGPTHNAIFHAADVSLAGATRSHGYIAASGNTLAQWFCPSCGTPVFAESSARPQFRTIRFGVLDEPHSLEPQMAIWTEDAPAWAIIDPKLECWPQQPPPPPSAS